MTRFGWIKLAVAFASTWLLCLPASAQSSKSTPTPAQIEVFQSLPPEQQRTILEQMNRGGQKLPDKTVDFPATTRPKVDQGQQSLSSYDSSGTYYALPPRLRPNDTLIIGLTVRPELLPESMLSPAPAPVQSLNPDGTLAANPSMSSAANPTDSVSTVRQIGATPKVPPSPAFLQGIDEFKKRVLEGNPYRLNRTGGLTLSGIRTIALAGLTEKEATDRLNTEPALRDFIITLQRLPVEPELQPFGYDLFTDVPTTFAPATDVPVPAEYVVGPGDTLNVQLIGERGGEYTLVVGRDGVIDFPQLGPIAVAGMRFERAKALIEQRVKEQMIGMRVAVSMGELRSIRVFVLGEAQQPGSYTVSGLSTITNALFASGGVKPIGSLRAIELKRSGRLVRKLDLYDLLLNGDTSNDVRLQPGDVIFVPPVGTTVAITGEVQRPAIYEVPEGAAASEILHLAGGLTPEADPRRARLERINERRSRTVVDINLTQPEGRGTVLQTGDRITIQTIRESLNSAVKLEGHVYRPGAVQFRSGMRLTDVIGSSEELMPSADLHYVLIRREIGAARTVSVVSADLEKALAQPGSEADPLLNDRDQIIVFDRASSRDRVVAPIIEQLRRQSGMERPSEIVGIGGRVKSPGQYPYELGMRISDLLRAGGSLDEAAYGGKAELTRYEVISGEQRETALIEIDLAGIRAGDPAADLQLRPFDFVVIKEVPQWGEQENVVLSGEVRFPGTYPVKRGETLLSVLKRAGGLTDLAFAEGGVFTRKDLQEREQKQLTVLAERMQRELASLSLQQAQSKDGNQTSEALAAGQALLSELKATQAVGRLVLDIDRIVHTAPGSKDDIVLRDGDKLFIPRITQEVTVIGEVQSATSHIYNPALTRTDYIERSGGPTQRADKKRIFVVRASGSVAPTDERGWFSHAGAGDVRPGDTIVVPLDAERMRPLLMWGAVTQIIYNLAIAAAAVNSF